MPSYSVVILIDLKKRDLLGAALIAHHLEQAGITTHLEPIESWRSCIYAWKPDMIIFNHLLHKHVTALSAQLNEWGILVGCLLNEGLGLSDNIRKYYSEPQYPDVHCDLFLAWNKPHEDALRTNKFVSPPENAVAVGIPRFDFYSQPWSAYYIKPKKTKRARILLNTTFALSHFYDRTPTERETLYRSLGNGKIPETLDYNQLIDDHYHGREQLSAYLKPLLESGDYEITLRPHPREDVAYYENLVEALPDAQKSLITVKPDEPVFSAILNSDITLNCEDCTTSAESWIAGKPTITLTFLKNALFFTELYATCSPQVSDAAELIKAIDQGLKEPEQPDYSSPRKAYLDKWLFKSDGNCANRAAQEIQRVLTEKDPHPNLPLSFSGIRRGLKVRTKRLINEPGHSRLKHIIKKALVGDRAKMSIRYRDYLKAIRPSDVAEARQQIREIAASLTEK
ncbi:MAG: surface carbohydrate biosynthesis protein [Akkermansiaceae bacterium]